MFEKTEVKVFVTTLNKVIKNLSAIKECPVDELKREVEENFDGYEYEEIDEVVGFDSWPDLSKEGEYQLNVKVDHEDAYELTLYTKIENGKATITNVL